VYIAITTQARIATCSCQRAIVFSAVAQLLFHHGRSQTKGVAGLVGPQIQLKYFVSTMAISRSACGIVSPHTLRFYLNGPCLPQLLQVSLAPKSKTMGIDVAALLVFTY